MILHEILLVWMEEKRLHLSLSMMITVIVMTVLMSQEHQLAQMGHSTALMLVQFLLAISWWFRNWWIANTLWVLWRSSERQKKYQKVKEINADLIWFCVYFFPKKYRQIMACMKYAQHSCHNVCPEHYLFARNKFASFAICRSRLQPQWPWRSRLQPQWPWRIAVPMQIDWNPCNKW